MKFSASWKTLESKVEIIGYEDAYSQVFFFSLVLAAQLLSNHAYRKFTHCCLGAQVVTDTKVDLDCKDKKELMLRNGSHNNFQSPDKSKIVF